MKRALAVLLCWIASTPAAAEVCDKVRPAWNPQDGPVGQFEDLAFFLSGPVGLTAIGLTVGALLLRSTWFSAVAVVIMLLILAMTVSRFGESDDIIRSAMAEGCMTTPYLASIALSAGIVMLARITLLDRSKSR